MGFIKITAFIFLFAVCTWYSNAQSPVVKDSASQYKVFYYDNGKISSEGFLTDDKPNGYWKTYYQNGNKKTEGNRVNFQLDGVWKFYQEDGSLFLEITYKDGKKNGIKRLIQKDEITEENFVNDVQDGMTTVYYPDRKIKSTIPFVKGKENGIGMEFAPDSSIITLMEYKKGYIINREKINRFDTQKRRDGKWKLFDKTGQLVFEGTYQNGRKNGYFKEYNKDGSLVKIEKYINDELQPDAPELKELQVRYDYYPDGKIKIEGSYNDTVPEGIRRYFDEKGKVTEARVYKNGFIISEGIIDVEGRKQGPWKEYYEPGKEINRVKILKAEGNYINDKRVGKWLFYYSNGQKEQEGAYNSSNQPIGDWKWYYENGYVRREESYDAGLREGMMKEYSDSGEVMCEGMYTGGQEEGKWFYHIGDEKEEGSYSAGKRSGDWINYYSDGKVRFKGSFLDDVENGKHQYFWENGQPKMEGVYEMGKRVGDWRYFNQDGSLFLVISYKDGVEYRYDGVRVSTTNPSKK